MQPSGLVGIATRYIAGRNSLQTVYWRSINTGDTTKMVKVRKTFNYSKAAKNYNQMDQAKMCRI